MRLAALLLAISFLALPLLVRADDAPVHGPPHGTLIIVGGGSSKGTGVLEKFIALAGGKDARLVIVPTAGGNKTPDGKIRVFDEAKVTSPWKRFGVKSVHMLHTHDPKVADTDDFVQPLREATGVWFDGGRQWHIVDSFKNTLTEREFHKVLERGGVVAGSSAGATIQGDYLVRGAIAGPDIVMTPEKEHERGFAFLRKSAIDQHIDARSRWDDLIPVIRKYPDHLGIGLAEGTAIVVKGDRFDVMGPGKVAIHDPTRKAPPWEKTYFVLAAGDSYDMKSRTVVAQAEAKSDPRDGEVKALRERIKALEVEVAELRKLLVLHDEVLKKIKSPAPPPPPRFPTGEQEKSGPEKTGPLPKITVLPGEWGGDVADVAAVCRSAASEIAKHLGDNRDADPISVRYRPKGPPMVIFGKGEGGERRVLLNSNDRAWAQTAYQFAHEYCHIQCNYREAKTPNLWFEETLCETASLFALKKMAETWKTNAPYRNWKSYSTSLADYAAQRIKATPAREGLTLAQWYARNEAALRADPGDRPKNEVVALEILPLLEKHPEHWQAVRHLNRWAGDKELTFAEYLRDWHERVPEAHKPFVAEIAQMFEIKLK